MRSALLWLAGWLAGWIGLGDRKSKREIDSIGRPLTRYDYSCCSSKFGSLEIIFLSKHLVWCCKFGQCVCAVPLLISFIFFRLFFCVHSSFFFLLCFTLLWLVISLPLSNPTVSAYVSLKLCTEL